MKALFLNLRIQLRGLILLLVGSGFYCLSDGDCSLLTADQNGYLLYKQTQYPQAAYRFADPMWQGVSLFRQGEFEKAASLFAGFGNAEAAFNHGNALVMQGKYTAAVERFTRALELRPDWGDARNNFYIATGRAEALRKEGGEMTGGMLEADEIVFNKGKPSPSVGEQRVETKQKATEAELRSIWLRQVQTKPADFLRAKFAYQHANRRAKEK